MKKRLSHFRQFRLMVQFSGAICLLIMSTPAGAFPHPVCKQACFKANVVQVEDEGNCRTFTLEVNAGGQCFSSLSHMTVEVLCGEVAMAENSNDWPLLLNTADASTKLYGLKMDRHYGEGLEKLEPFTLTYTLCADEGYCLDMLDQAYFKVAYSTPAHTHYQDVRIIESRTNGHLEKPAFTATATVTNLICYEESGGQIDVNVQGGTAPYTFNWDHGVASEDLANVKAGIYNLVITDARKEHVRLSVEVKKDADCQINAY